MDARSPYNSGEKVYVYDQEGNKVMSNEQATKAKQLYVGVLDVGLNEVVAYEKATIFPTVGFHTFDQRYFVDKNNGERKRESHIGNPVSSIQKKDGTVLR